MMNRPRASTLAAHSLLAAMAVGRARCPIQRSSESSFIVHHSSFGRRGLAIATLLGIAAALPGCLQRRMHITSEPPGATVWVNGVEIGQTPVEAEFTFYGTYDVRLHHEGYDPVAAAKWAVMPWYEIPPLDFLVTALPWNVTSVVRWDFDLARSPDLAGPDSDAARAGLLQRADELRERTSP